MNCDCDTLKCEVDALKANQDELFQRTEDLKNELSELQPFVIAFVADTGTAGDAQDEMMELINSWSPDAIVLGGDNNYPDGDPDDADDNLAVFNDYIDEEKVYPVIGNHDEYTDAIPLPDNYLYDKFPYVLASPAYDYSVVVPNRDVELFFVNDGYRGEDDISPLGIQDNLSEQARLAERLSASAKAAKLIFSHRSFAGPDIDGESNRYSDNGLNNINLMSLGVKAIFSGHTHTAWHMVGISGLHEGLHLVDCSDTTQEIREFTDPVSIVGANADDMEIKWKFDYTDRHAVKILIFKTKIRVEFWGFDAGIVHGFNINI